MHRTKTPHYRRTLLLCSLFVATVCSSLLSHATVQAADSQVQVLVGDVCPNIPGNQPTLPSGMQFDQNGDCFTPAPPPPPDACPNIPGNQSAITKGYYRNQAGNCVLQTSPPKDVCPNISGTQSSVPEGMETASNGDCVQPLSDACPNITGPQASVPDGMRQDEQGSCYTPAVTEGPKGTPGKKPVTPATSDPLISWLVNLIPKPFKDFLTHLPPHIAESIPFYIIAILILVSLGMLWQTFRESSAAARFLIFFKRKKKLDDTKDEFIVLSSHFLQATLTTMLTNLRQNSSAPEPLVSSVTTLGLSVDSLVADVDADAKNNVTDSTEGSGSAVRILGSPLFWIPVILTAITVLFADFLLGAINELDSSVLGLSMQAMVFLVACVLFYFSLHARRIRHIRRQRAEKLVEQEYAIDAKRNEFLASTIPMLRNGVRDIQSYENTLADASFSEGYDKLVRTLGKLELLSQIQADAPKTTKFKLSDVLNSYLLQHEAEIDAKKLTVTNTADDHELTQNRPLFGFVIASILDNAVRFNNIGGNITISSEAVSHGFRIHVSDSGNGMTDERLEKLFKPSLIPSETSTYKELSLSLFLDKIIMSYLGGEITAVSTPGKGTTLTISV